MSQTARESELVGREAARAVGERGGCEAGWMHGVMMKRETMLAVGKSAGSATVVQMCAVGGEGTARARVR